MAVVSLGQLALESFVAGASLLVGLFFYDAISVFKSDAMMTVATKVCACPVARRPQPKPTVANTSGRSSRSIASCAGVGHGGVALGYGGVVLAKLDQARV